MKRPRYLRGLNATIAQTPDGYIVNGRTLGEWEQPWSLTVVHEETAAKPEGEWRAFVLPGLVNGKDAHIAMEAKDVPLTDDPAPYLVLSEWRDALRGGNGYPAFFKTLGVKPLDREDPTRTREIRALDVVLVQPRTGSRLDVRLGEPLLDAQTQFLDTVFVNDYARSVGGRARLKTVPRWTPPEDQPIADAFGLLLKAGDEQLDEIKLATVWMVSPPGGKEEDVPDFTWDPWPQYAVWWNLKHATRITPPTIAPQSLQLLVPLAGGVAQPVINTLLSFINDENEAARAFLDGADARGRFWA